MEVINLNTRPRTSFGKGPSRQARRAGLIPAIVYRDGVVQATISLDPAELELALGRTNNPNALLMVHAEGKDRICIVKDHQRHPISRRLLHVDLYEVLEDRAIVVDVKVEATGRCVGVKAGGELKQLTRTLKVETKPADIPTSIVVDITALEIGKSIRVADIQPPTGTRLVYDVNFNVFMVVGHEAEAEAPVAAAAAAPGKAAPAKAAPAKAAPAKAPAGKPAGKK